MTSPSQGRSAARLNHDGQATSTTKKETQIPPTRLVGPPISSFDTRVAIWIRKRRDRGMAQIRIGCGSLTLCGLPRARGGDKGEGLSLTLMLGWTNGNQSAVHPMGHRQRPVFGPTICNAIIGVAYPSAKDQQVLGAAMQQWHPDFVPYLDNPVGSTSFCVITPGDSPQMTASFETGDHATSQLNGYTNQLSDVLHSVTDKRIADGDITGRAKHSVSACKA
ncbi:hypothetical protein GLOTRDRAFT_90285 [Gloeophyllum trabeum ATCC 11539]|uniref:Uncharacterized protein n=1 Tax=Gloeophyllum trabeum (strain ATCC 11539 / FP-39264 / Madison 617) TaxID=670483 RepID=S7QN98_GLOTA|nr:uncharacterized protein GLOTRDRAFT_90285 [Gloeophyllum trabeum ATCC 11539]EPQ60962.1 hypothetical protein GLOTRDRAFT_90285 [Gloeophyllum trabeum ATCC 11539]